MIEGVSGTGKSSVCRALRRRGYATVDGDNELAYQGNPQTGAKTAGRSHAQHIWDVEKVKALVSQSDDEVTFFCGGSRNVHQFVGLFTTVFILEVDAATLNARLDSRLDDDWGKSASERALILRLHKTKEDSPSGVSIDATQPLEAVVDAILTHVL